MGHSLPDKKSLVVVGFGLLLLTGVQPTLGQGTFFTENGVVGVGTDVPEATLHVLEPDATRFNRVLLRLTGESFAPQAEYEDGSTGVVWRAGMNSAGDFVINDTADLGTAEMRITTSGQIFVNGTQVHPDYVFAPGYSLPPVEELAAFIEENGHLPGVLTAEEREREGGIDLTSFPLQLLEKIEELSLYTIDQQRLIRELRASNEALATRVEALERQVQRAAD